MNITIDFNYRTYLLYSIYLFHSYLFLDNEKQYVGFFANFA